MAEPPHSAEPRGGINGGHALAVRESQIARVGRPGRVPPQSVDVERAVLGAMLIEREAIARATARRLDSTDAVMM